MAIGPSNINATRLRHAFASVHDNDDCDDDNDRRISSIGRGKAAAPGSDR